MQKGIHYKITHPAHKLWMIALVAAAGSALCIGILAFVDGVAKGDYLLVAPFGATMVLVFGLPQSPLAHPKNVVFGHLTTAITGIIFANFLTNEKFYGNIYYNSICTWIPCNYYRTHN